MPSTATSILDGLSTSVAVKAPCRTVATSNITLAGLQTISGYTTVENDRVLVKGQTNAVDNGIYMASTGNWTRAKDADGNRDLVQGTRVLIRSTTIDGVEYELTTANPIVIGTTALTFELRYGANVTYDQTEAEIAAGVTPSDYEYEPGNVKRYGALGDFDGTTGTDDTAALQRCIDVVQLSNDFLEYGSHSPSLGTCRMFLPAGNYRITSALLVTRKIAIEGEGQAEFSSGARIVQTGANSNTFTITPGAGGMSFSIERLTLKAQAAGTGHLVDVQKGTSQCNSQRYIDCIFAEPQDKSLKLIGDDILVSGCLFDVSGLSGEAIQLGTSTAGETASNVTITGCNFFSVVIRCILVFRAYGVAVIGNKVTQQLTPPNSTINFFDAQGGTPAQCERVAIVGNVFENVRQPFSASSNVRDVIFSSNIGSGLGIGAGEIYNALDIKGACSNITIVGNTLSGTYDTKNFFNGSDTATNITIAGNSFINTGGSGAALVCGAMTGLVYPNRFSGFLTNITASDLMALGVVIQGLVTLTYSASISTDAALGSQFNITVSDGSAFTINNPTNGSVGQCITYMIRNNFGTLGAITWGAAFKLAAFTAPTAGGTNRSITFRYDGATWVEISRVAADVPN